MKKIISFVFISFISAIVHAELTVQVAPQQVTYGESFNLTLTQEGSQSDSLPDLSVLQPNFEIVGTQRSMSYTIINGQSQSVSQWIINLKAKKTGILTIPAIKSGTEFSTPITINVQPGVKNQVQEQIDSSLEGDVLLSATADVKKPYVNQQVLYTVKVMNSKRLLDADFQGPQVDDALLIPLGDTKRYQAVQNNTNYVVEEQNYAIFPQKSGTVKIISPTFTALVYEMNPTRVKAQDKTVQLSVLPIPKQFKGKNWLPAKQVKLSDQYENSTQKIEQGSTLTRTVVVEGVAIPAQLLPKLDFVESDAYKIYPEKPKESNQISQGELVGATEIKITYLFNKPGKITIPELKLPWFNTTTGKQETAVLPPRSLEIIPGTGANNQATTPTTKPESTTTTDATAKDAKESTVSSSWAWIVAFIFALAWLLTLGLWGWQKRARLQGRGQYKVALTELSKACAECNPTKARDALLKWASLHWPDAPLLNLTDLTKLVRDAHLKKQLHLLSQVLYRTEERALWRGDELLRCVQAINRSKPGKNKKNSTLPPINPC